MFQKGRLAAASATQIFLRALRQRNCLERTHHIIRPGVGEKALIKTGPEIPMVALVIFIAIKTPDAADHDERADPVIPEIAQVMKTEISARGRSFEPDVIVNDQLGHANIPFQGLGMRLGRFGRAGMIAERAHFPFRVDNTAVLRREFSFRCCSHSGDFFRL
jgi:hypothetical protein